MCMRRRCPSSLRATVYLTSAAVLLLIGCSIVAWARLGDVKAWDTPLYHVYGQRIVDGGVPYRDFRVVYPPAALPTFVAASYNLGFSGATAHPVWEPRLNPAARRYARSFAIEVVAALAVTIMFTASSLRSLRASTMHVAAALGLLAISPLLLGDLVFTRFDALPAASTAAAIAVLLGKRFRVAGSLLGLGVATKLYPALLVPPAAIFAWKHRGRWEAAAVVVCAAGTALAIFLPFLAIAPHGLLWSLRAQVARGVQVESLASSVVVAMHVLTRHMSLHGLPVSTVFAPIRDNEALNTTELGGRAADAAGLATGVLAALAILVVWIRFARSSGSEFLLVRYAAAAITAQIAFGRVLSPQFLIWLLPLVPLVGNRRGRVAFPLFVSVLAVTNVWFPDEYRRFISSEGAGPTAILLARNGLLVLLLLTLLVTRNRLPRARLWSTLTNGGHSERGTRTSFAAPTRRLNEATRLRAT
jgi:hypothetical protein